VVYFSHSFDLRRNVGQKHNDVSIEVTVGCENKLYMFPVPVVRILNILPTFVANCSFALLATIIQ